MIGGLFIRSKLRGLVKMDNFAMFCTFALDVTINMMMILVSLNRLCNIAKF